MDGLASGRYLFLVRISVDEGIEFNLVYCNLEFNWNLQRQGRRKRYGGTDEEYSQVEERAITRNTGWRETARKEKMGEQQGMARYPIPGGARSGSFQPMRPAGGGAVCTWWPECGSETRQSEEGTRTDADTSVPTLCT